MAADTIAIVGAGHAGGRTALALRELGFAGPIELIGAEEFAPYERPPLSKEMITGELELGASELASTSDWAAQNITLRLSDPAVSVDAEKNVVQLSSGREVNYRHLVFATGADVRKLAVFEQTGLPVSYLRTRKDAEWLKARLRPGVRAIVIGAGVIGLELASSITKAGGSAIVVEAGPTVMGRATTPIIADRLIQLHQSNNVSIKLSVMAVRAEQTQTGLSVTLDNNETIEGDFAIIGVGVIPNDAIADSAGIQTDDGIIVDATGKTNIANIWAVGDVAKFPRKQTLERQETWRHADNHARLVASAIMGEDVSYDDVPGYWSDQFGVRLQVEGDLIGDEVLRLAEDGIAMAAFYLQDGFLVGVAAIDQPKLIALGRRAIAAGHKLDPALLSDTSIKPKKALAPL